MAEFMSIKEVAAMIGVSGTTIQNWMRRGLIVPIRFGRTIRFNRSKLLLEIEKMQTRGYAQPKKDDPMMG